MERSVVRGEPVISTGLAKVWTRVVCIFALSFRHFPLSEIVVNKPILFISWTFWSLIDKIFEFRA